MYTVIGGDQQEYGPATAEEIVAWIADGRLSHGSLMKGAGRLEWHPLSEFPEFADALRQQASAMSTSVPPAIPPAAWARPEPAGAPELRIGRCLSRGGELAMAHFGVICGGCFLVWLIGLVCQLLPLGILYLFLRSVLYGGLFVLILGCLRGRETSLGEVFSGFRGGFGHLLLAGVVSGLLSWLGLFFCVLPGIYLYIAWIFCVPLVADKQMEFWSAMEHSRRTVTRVWPKVFALAVIAFLPTLLAQAYLEIKVFLALYPTLQGMMTPGNIDFAQMMEAARKVALATAPLALLGKLVLLLNLPFGLCALMYAYEDLFGPRPGRTP